MSKSIEFSERPPTEPGWYWVRPKKWIHGFSHCQIIQVVDARDIDFNILRQHGYSSLVGKLTCCGVGHDRWQLVDYAAEHLLFSVCKIEEPAEPEEEPAADAAEPGGDA